MDQNKWEPQQPHIKEHVAKRNIREEGLSLVPGKQPVFIVHMQETLLKQ
jgi:hypothetical protein